MIPRLRQPLPSEPTRILSGHPLARNIAIALCFNQTGYAITNAVTGQLAGTVTLPSVVSERKVTPTGVALGTTGLTASATPGVTMSVPGWLINSEGTIVLRLRWVSSDDYGSIVTEGSGKGLFARSTGAVELYPASTSFEIMTSGEWTTIASTRAVDGTVRYYKDGVFFYQAITGSTVAITFDTLFNDNASESFHGDIEFVHLWSNRLLSEGEIYDQFVNPYSIYQPSFLTNTLYHYPVVGGAGWGPLLGPGRNALIAGN